jgi:hypothetical protein
MRHMVLVGLLVSVLLSSAGCAFGNRTVHLNEVKLRPVAGTAPVDSPAVVVAAPVDQRGETDCVGCVRNTFYMRTAKVVADGDVCAWVQDCLAAGLRQYGYQVTKASPGDAPPGAGIVVVRPTVMKVFCDSYLRYCAEVQVSVDVVTGGEPVFLGTYHGTWSSMNWTARAESYQESLEEAMRECLTSMVPSIAARIRAGKAG